MNPPPPGLPADNELIKTMEIVWKGPARLQSDNLGYVNIGSVKRNRDTSDSEGEEDSGGETKHKTWSSVWHRGAR